MTAMAWLLPSLEAGLLSDSQQGAEKEGPAHSSSKIGARLPKKLLFFRATATKSSQSYELLFFTSV